MTMMPFSIAASVHRHVLLVACIAWALSACSKQSSSDFAHDAEQHADYLRADVAWTARLQSRWVREDLEGETPASPAHELRFDDHTLLEVWTDGTQREGQWTLRDASPDVIHLLLDSETFDTQLWRIFLPDEDELVLFMPGHEPCTYYREGSAPFYAALGKERREAATESSSTSTAEAARQANPSLPYADEDEKEVEALHERLGAPTQAALERQMRSVNVAISHPNKKLGERLIIGRWSLSNESLENLDNSGALEGLTLYFGPSGAVHMETALAGDLTTEGGVWRLEGMYGPEVRVILTLTGSSSRRERMLFLDIDRFVLSPQDEALIFERIRP